ncbi:hypothetical protein SAMN04488498_1291 [Mesorhizobium albiziae]|uniref:Uncharacterized protein n=1 Tax=Neomesorhizobium albiziae TaxID=335020 RepID=A0A1I4EQ08_9HYPH|nr:hypothetical protein [Mesorhizobium albiziae]GLS30729.1 hypothetical protein GCM10007937_24370 [Mesorhizobium albiziae]SFL07379.1 hypothetical protein SAMN04488498_1291 [Mesorhizobium albiziae]
MRNDLTVIIEPENVDSGVVVIVGPVLEAMQNDQIASVGIEPATIGLEGPKPTADFCGFWRFGL